MTIRHISFDVWNTLLTSNPTFVSAREKFLVDFFRFRDVGPLRLAYAEVKRQADGLARYRNVGPLPKTFYLMLFDELMKNGELTHHSVSHADIDIDEILINTQQLFVEHPPIVPRVVVDVVSKLLDKGYSLSVASNTVFMPGQSVHSFIQDFFPCNAFAFGCYSDQIGMAKPSTLFFNHILSKTFKRFNLNREQILHIGDDGTCDTYGAGRAYMQSAPPISHSEEIPAVLASKGIVV